jgi:hypothetical protein
MEEEMRKGKVMSKKIVILYLFFLISNFVSAQPAENSESIILPLNSAENLDLINLKAQSVEKQGKQGIRLETIQDYSEGETIAIIPGIKFKNGIIEVELAGEPAMKGNPQARGFVGIAFRVHTTKSYSYECFYIRPANGRAAEQLRRNHSTQYISHPEFPWYRLRQESPGVYESYVDLVPGEWTRIKIEVSGMNAKLYVHDTEQPCLIVSDLKHGEAEGEIALWLHSSTLAHFRNLVVIPSID